MTRATVNRTVMIVDDTEDVRELLRLQLTMLGCRVVEAANGREALEIASKESPELILMDLTMPVLDGIEATRLIRERAENSGVVIVALTALGCAESQQRAFAAGCNDYVHKPLGSEQLLSLLDRHLS